MHPHGLRWSKERPRTKQRVLEMAMDQVTWEQEKCAEFPQISSIFRKPLPDRWVRLWDIVAVVKFSLKFSGFSIENR
jgi:hypothetical protein